MSTNYPASVDALTNPTGTDPLTNPSHSAQHTNVNDAVEAIETYASRGKLGYAEVTADQTGIVGSEVDLTGLSVAVTAGTSRRIKIAVQGQFYTDGTDHRVGLYIQEGATKLQQGNFLLSLTSGAQLCRLEAIIAPSAGAHTYKVVAQRTTGGGNVILFAAATRAAFILVEDIGNA
jgi:hypothetical protein